MDLKQEFLSRAMRVVQDPRVIKAMQDPRVMQAMLGAVQLRARVQQNVESTVQRLARNLNLATEAEVRELRRLVRRLEQELAAEREERGDEVPRERRD
ncbi:MAG: hypothetical protein PVI30_16315 [Myxococcales bacterium]